MIKNDRQYRLTKAHVREFSDALANAATQPTPRGIDPALADIQRKALDSQLQEMVQDVHEYEALKEGKITLFEAQSLAELPLMLVKARISRGLTQKELAERLNVKEQQVQRWEANDYAAASLDTLKAVSEALDVAITQQLLVPKRDFGPKQFLATLDKAGLSRDFLLSRIIPSRIAASFRDDVASFKEVVSGASVVGRIFGMKVPDLITPTPPVFNYQRVAATRFKLPARANRAMVDAYTIYAHYLAALLVDCVPKRQGTIPVDFHDFRNAVALKKEPVTFEGLLRFLWDLGVVVLPLRDAGGFHGAVWKIKGRFVIVLKQSTALESRWLYDALHETGHITNGDVTDEAALVEEDEISPDASSEEEEKANEWAENVLFDGRAEEIEEACTLACKGNLPKLKAVLPDVAKDFRVNLGSLANHMAYRLGQQGESWWGAAQNLQPGGEAPFNTARMLLLENVNLVCLSEFDRELLQRALSE
jgi:transcriptional regulator with XRE-family HTH domain